MSRIVLVPAVAEAVVFEIVRELPPEFNPSIVTFLAPLRLTNGLPAVTAPVTVRAPLGLMASDAQLPPVGVFRLPPLAGSAVSLRMVTRMVLLVWVVLALSAVNASAKVA